MSELLLRYFLEGEEASSPEHQFKYAHASCMIVPRVGERVWLDDDLCIMVDAVTYSPVHGEDDGIYLIDIDAIDITKDMLEEGY